MGKFGDLRKEIGREINAILKMRLTGITVT
jgi:hypothetical protein